MTATVRVEVAEAEVDLAVDVLWTSGALGVHEEASVTGVRLVSAFDETVDPEAVGQLLRLRLPAARVDIVDDDGSWWDAWRAHARPVVAGAGRVVVVPPWWTGEVPTPAAGGVVAVLDPGRTFGSGAHATTRLVLDELAALPVAGARVLDVGGGSGVLAVVAARLGASEAVAVDIDPACEAVVAANAAANGVGATVRAVTGRLDTVAGAEGPFEVTVANVLLPVLAELAPAIERRAGTWLVLSGMLEGTQERAEALFPNWHVVRRTTLDGWAACLLSRARFLAEPNEELP